MTVVSLQGKSILLTGATRGIGLAVAERLATHGAKLLLTARGEDALSDLADRLKPIAQAKGGNVAAMPGDASDAKTATAWVASTVQHFGRLDIMINNAGVAPKFGLLQEVSIEDLDRTIDINLKGPLYLMHAAVPVMVNQGSGTILNLNSVAGRTAYPYSAVYCASKSGLKGLTESVAMEQRSNGIRVIGLYPGEADTPIWQDLEPGVTQNVQTMLTASEVADAVEFILTRGGNAYVTDLQLIPLKAVDHGG